MERCLKCAFKMEAVVSSHKERNTDTEGRTNVGLLINSSLMFGFKFQLLLRTEGFLIYWNLKCIHNRTVTEAGHGSTTRGPYFGQH
jgi:hypothetical protein